MLTQKRLKELLHYNPETGIFVWKISVSNIKAGSTAGYEMSAGYSEIGIKNKRYYVHHLAWLYMYGEFPKGDIYHINHNRSDNRISNLRTVTRQENTRNASKSAINTSGVTGVSWNKPRHVANLKYGFHPNHGKSNTSTIEL